MKEVAVRCTGQALVPIDDVSEETLRALAGKDVIARIFQPRNPKHGAWAHKLFKLVADNHPRLDTIEAVKTHLKMRLGYYDPEVVTVMINGKQQTGIRYCPRSMSFASMDQATFNDFMQAAIRVVLEELLPGIEDDDMAMEILRYAA